MLIYYEAMLVCGDYEGRLKEITEVLNTLDLGDGDLYFRVFKNRIVVEYPAGHPTPRVLDLPDETTVYGKEGDDAKLAERKEGECDPESVNLRSLKWDSENVSPLLTKGTLEIVRVYNEFYTAGVGGLATTTKVGRLAIRYDGFAEIHSHWYGLKDSQQWTVVFDPHTQSIAWS